MEKHNLGIKRSFKYLTLYNYCLMAPSSFPLLYNLIRDGNKESCQWKKNTDKCMLNYV